MDRWPRRSPRGTHPHSRLPIAVRTVVPITLALTALLVVSGLVAYTRPQLERSSHEPNAYSYDWAAAPESHRPNPRALSVGVTHSQYSIDSWGDEAARASARNVLTATAAYQNQHMFGWGTLNPEPRPGAFDWSSLDSRIRLIQSTGGTPVITLCCAPDWMKGGRAGETDWTRLHVAPSPEHYGDFAQLAVAVARRYPDVRHFLVWNEMKGFWDNARNRWDYEAYTNLYNIVYDALRAAVPGVAVGGPYVVIDTWADRAAGGHPSTLSGECGTVDQRSLDVLDYWLRNKHGADFVAVDGGVDTRDAGALSSTTVNSALFGAMTRWVRERTPLPVWWSEFHVGQAPSDGQRQLVASVVATLLHMADQGAAAAFLWQPQGGADDAHEERPPALWTSTQTAGGGRPLALAEAVAQMQQVLADVADDDVVSWPVPEVGVLHSQDALLVVNTADNEVTVRIWGLRLRLEPYEVRRVRIPPGTSAPPPAWWTPSVDQCLRQELQPIHEG